MAVLNVRDLSKEYDGRHILHQVNLTLHEGEIVSVLGPSGCGKSTLLRLVAGLDDDYVGEVHVAGPVGVIFQEPRLFPWLTVRQNIAFGDRPSPGEVEALAASVGLADFLDASPKQLSGGMAQRCAIARALIKKPRILLLDEPFSALDAFTRMHLHDLVLQIRETYQATLLLITHDIREAAFLSDRVVIMSDRPGRVLKETSLDVPWPRERVSPELMQIERDILNELGFGMNPTVNGWKEKTQ